VIQLKVVGGTKVGAECQARRFPVRIGRAGEANLRLEDDGVWDLHLEIHPPQAEGFILTVQPGAFAAVNGQAVEQAVLRNGDLIELGAARLQFGFTPTRHRSLRLREALTWIALALLCLGQVALVYWLPG
jgi:hypothetical protein